MTDAASTSIPMASKSLPTGLLPGLCRTYAELLRRQRTAMTPFARWSKVTSRAHEFVWVGGAEKIEVLMAGRGPLVIRRDSPLFDSVRRMHATLALNPYEREVLYGYPFVIGRIEGHTIRGPLLTLAVRIEAEQDRFFIHAADEVVRFNALPFQNDSQTEAGTKGIDRVVEATPPFPVESDALRAFVTVVARELHCDDSGATLEGRLSNPPQEPRARLSATVIDQAAIFVAPKTSYFLTSDLDLIAKGDESKAHESGLPTLITGAGADPQDEITDEEIDGKVIYFPFPSNRSQRRAAILAENSTARVIRVEGPPGTGKSLTIANLACHLAATGRTVLITSQKDKALQVVDEKLCELGLDELPMTLLHRDRASKRQLITRLDAIRKDRAAKEVATAHEALAKAFQAETTKYVAESKEYATALGWQERVARAHSAFLHSRGIRRLFRRFSFARTIAKSRRVARRETDVVADSASASRRSLLSLALDALRLGREHAVATATRQERQGLRELSAVLKRDQAAHKNFSLFDRLKQQPERAEMLLRMLPVWIMTPDDVARLFPCRPGLFDFVIVDEASQVDLPSVAPVIYRGKKLVVFGDSKQMQPRRFAFMNVSLSQQLWQQHGMHKHDPDRWLHPVEQNLLSLSTIRAEEENLLDEHFRSMPPIIRYSNQRWYDGRLRIMTDERQKRFGGPGQPIIQLHHVASGVISNGSQENELEARAVLALLSGLVSDPDYDGASIGVLCLFEEQVALLQELVAEAIPVEEWEDHNLTVINPDGFQGDERDVVLYSLSYDAQLMPRAAISARMNEQAHIQGMLNVAFTRGRDEIHVFHSAPIESFTFADGRASALSDWLRHGKEVEAMPPLRSVDVRLGTVDSEFEADVAAALRSRGLTVTHQYPSCGFFIDLVAESSGARLAVECDGERHHLDEHGGLRAEDLERQAILERAGWRVARIPYRRWLTDPEGEVQRIVAMLTERSVAEDSGEDEPPDGAVLVPADPVIVPASANGQTVQLNRGEAALLKIVNGGERDEEAVLRHVRDELGLRRLGKNVRAGLLASAKELAQRGLLVIEDGEYFPTQFGKTAVIEVIPGSVTLTPRYRGYRRYRRSW